MEEDALCLRLFDGLPHLLSLTKEIADRMNNERVSPYPVQDELREQYRRRGLAFCWSMPLRHYGPCRQCKERFTEIWYLLENPMGSLEETRKLGMRESKIHAVRVHGDHFTEAQRAFFRGLNKRDAF